MKFCENCNKEFNDDLNFCPICGANLSTNEEKIKFCPICGKELEEDANFCPACGNPTKINNKTQNNENSVKAMRPPLQGVGVIMAFMIISCIISFGSIITYIGLENYAAMAFLGILPLLWKIPMTISFFNSANNFQKISTAFKVCVLLFVSSISGIILLCNKDL